MTDKKKGVRTQPTVDQKIDLLYQWLNKSLESTRDSIIKEVKYSSVQIGALHQQMSAEKDKSSQAIAQEIRYSYKQNQTIYDGLATMVSEDIGERLNALDSNVATLTEKATAQEESQTALQAAVDQASQEILEKVSALENVDSEALASLVEEKVAALVKGIEDSVGEVKYSYLQQQSIYDGLTALITGEVVAKLDDINAKLAAFETIDKTLAELNEKLQECITLIEEADYKTLVESVAEKTEESVSEHSRQVLDAVAAIPVAENVDYDRIVDEVGDKVLELLGEVGLNEPAPVVHSQPQPAQIDYDRIIYGAAEKVVESLPYPDKVDYRRINDNFVKAAESVQVTVGDEVIENAVAAAVEKVLATLDVDKIAAAVAEKIVVPEVPQFDYDLLADKVLEKMVVPQPEEINYDLLADMVSERLAANVDQVYDVVLDETGIDQIAERVSEKLGQIENIDYDKVGETVAQNVGDPVDYEKIAGIVEDKLASQPCEEPAYELVVDDESVQAIAKTIAEELCATCANCEAVEEEPVEEETVEEAPAEEPVPEVVEETVEEAPVEEPVVEEVAEEPVVEEAPVEEPVVEEAPAAQETASEELAVAAEFEFDEENNQLVDAETGLVIRLKRSFTAKMKQSEERVKEYYSDIKNELTSYKKINSNVSWHGDRFNYGRDTVAKVNICGKTLCFYLALDPEDPEYKTTIYHQKNVGNQKAYENTPFMFKVKSDAAVKKALRLVGYLAEKVGAVKDEKFEAVDYVSEFAYETTKQLYDEGYIKATKEKKVDLTTI